MKNQRHTLAKIILTVIFLFSVSVYADSPFSQSTCIVKFKNNSEIYKDLRAKINSSGERTINFEILSSLSSQLHLFSTKYFIKNITAAKPNADETELPAGMQRIFFFELNSKQDMESYIAQLKKEPFIEYAEYDFIGYGSGKPEETSVIPNDPQFGNQWGLRNTGQVINSITGIAGNDINIAGAWDITTGSPNIKIGVLDSGMPLAATEFTGRLTPGYDFANNDNNPTDDQGHGSNVGSVIGAKGNNGSVMAGVNWNSKLIPVKILDANNSGLYSWWVSGITYAVDSGAKVLNMSVGGSGFSQALQDAVTYATSRGTIVVVCMMNNNNAVPYYPAAFDNVIAIGAINNRGKRAVPFCWGGGSSYGSHIDFCAPGEMILGLNYQNTNAVTYWCGTSQATPMVTGIVSLMLSKNQNLSYSSIYNILKASAIDTLGNRNAGWNQYYGWGRIDAAFALAQVIPAVNSISTEVPEEFYLSQNYPNPFNPSTKISFGVSVSSDVRMNVYDLTGKEVAELVNERVQPGKYEVTFDASALASGTYFVRINAGSYTESKKITLLK
ncbi:MAG: S8 family peptidase [Ignavibacteria bacterium]|nr:S8 family peptidase [Ignavibacteria bacterium]